jgi:hypothetical protein
MRSRGMAASRVAVLAMILILLLVPISCTGSAREGSGSVGDVSTTRPGGDPGGDPGEGLGGDPGEGAGAGGAPSKPQEDVLLDRFVERCQKATQRLSRANVVYDPEMQMNLGGTTTVTAVVTLDTRLPAQSVLPDQGATTKPILAACEVQARLRGDSSEFVIQPSDWESRSLVEALDANWTWLVKPQIGGTFSIVLDLKPIVKLGGRSADRVSSRELTTVSFPSKVVVSAPADERITDMATRTRNVFNSLSGLLKALLVFLTLAVALVTGAWLKGRGRSDSA